MRFFVQVSLVVFTPLLTHGVACGDVVFASNMYPPSSYPNPDPKFQKIGDYVFYKEMEDVGPFELAEADGIQKNFAQGLFQITELRMVQPASAAGGTLSIYESDPNMYKPLNMLTQVATSTTLLNENGVVLTSWDFSATNLVLDANKPYFLVMNTPMAWYAGISEMDFIQFPTGWFGATLDQIAPAYEIRGVAVPSPATGLVMLGISGLACSRRRRA